MYLNQFSARREADGVQQIDDEGLRGCPPACADGIRQHRGDERSAAHRKRGLWRAHVALRWLSHVGAARRGGAIQRKCGRRRAQGAARQC